MTKRVSALWRCEPECDQPVMCRTARLVTAGIWAAIPVSSAVIWGTWKPSWLNGMTVAEAVWKAVTS